jgi:hypothetical protein
LFSLLALTSCAKPFSENPDAMEQASKSVVELSIFDYNDNLIATGSGFFMFDSNTIITNYHVIASAYRIEATDDEDAAFSIDTIYNLSDEKDIAILRATDMAGEYSPLILGDSSVVQRGEEVVAIGSPLGLKNTISTGTVSNISNKDGVEMIQFTAAISNGSSGGVLLNNSGEVIGITSGSFTAGQNLNMAVAVSEIEKLYAKAPIELSVAKYYEENTIPTIVPGTLVIGTSADFEPLEYYDHAGNIIGIEPEIMKAIADYLGLDVMIIDCGFDDLLSNLEKGLYDCVVSGMEYVPERRTTAIISNPFFTLEGTEDDFSTVAYITKDNVKLQSAINDAIVQLTYDNTIESILNKYNAFD